jgi:hypothetical protein
LETDGGGGRERLALENRMEQLGSLVYTVHEGEKRLGKVGHTFLLMRLNDLHNRILRIDNIGAF